jgi:hypothetical protein
MKTEKFADSYRLYLGIRGASKEDPIARDLQKRTNR